MLPGEASIGHPEAPSTASTPIRDTPGAQTGQQGPARRSKGSPRRRPLLSDVRPCQQQPCRRRRGSCCNSSTIGACGRSLQAFLPRSAASPPARPCKPSGHPASLQDEGDPHRRAPSSGQVRHHALLHAPGRLQPLHSAPGHARSAMSPRTRQAGCCPAAAAAALRPTPPGRLPTREALALLPACVRPF